MLSNAIQELKQRKNQIASQIVNLRGESKKLSEAINVLSKLSGAGAIATAPARKKISAAGRKRIAAFQKARWAKIKAGKASTPATKPAKKRKKLSAAARKRISEFQKARWAKIKAAKKK